MVDLDLQNSRMKDFYDIWILSRTLGFSGDGLSQAMRFTFQRRQTDVPTMVTCGLDGLVLRRPYSRTPMERVCSAYWRSGSGR